MMNRSFNSIYNNNYFKFYLRYWLNEINIENLIAIISGDFADSVIFDILPIEHEFFSHGYQLRYVANYDYYIIKERASWVIGTKKDNLAFYQLIDQLEEKDTRIQEISAWALGEIGDNRAIYPLLDVFYDSTSSIKLKETIIFALGKLGGKISLINLIRALKFKKIPSLRAASAVALGDIGDMEAISSLVQTIRYSDSITLKELATKSLGKIYDWRSVEGIKYALSQSEPSIRCEGIEALKNLNMRSCVDLLVGLLSDDDIKVKKNALNVLCEIGNKDALWTAFFIFPNSDLELKNQIIKNIIDKDPDFIINKLPILKRDKSIFQNVIISLIDSKSLNQSQLKFLLRNDEFWIVTTNAILKSKNIPYIFLEDTDIDEKLIERIENLDRTIIFLNKLKMAFHNIQREPSFTKQFLLLLDGKQLIQFLLTTLEENVDFSKLDIFNAYFKNFLYFQPIKVQIIKYPFWNLKETIIDEMVSRGDYDLVSTLKNIMNKSNNFSQFSILFSMNYNESSYQKLKLIPEKIEADPSILKFLSEYSFNNE